MTNDCVILNNKPNSKLSKFIAAGITAPSSATMPRTITCDKEKAAIEKVKQRLEKIKVLTNA
jgi:hypothetical protein